MKTFLQTTLLYLLRFALSLRYRVTVKGVEKLTPENLNRPGGILFLPNHSAIFVDPALVNQYIWKRFRPRPMIVEYFYYTPIVNTIMKWMRALPVPNFDTSSNSLKRRRNDKVFQSATRALRDGDNFLIYPAGRLKSTGREVIGGASGVHRLLEEAPQTNVVLIRLTGLWGSSFSRAWTGKSPPFFSTLWQGIKVGLKNLIFFTPRRNVEIEFCPAPADFPFQGSRIELNRWLERWYNEKWDPEYTGDLGEPFKLVPYSRWSRKLPDVEEFQQKYDEVDINRVPLEVKQRILTFLGKLTERDPETFTTSQSLASDLGLDSLDAAEIIVFLEDNYDVTGLQPPDLTTVGQIMGLAAGLIGRPEESEEELLDLKRWHADNKRPEPGFIDGKTIPECFLRRCDLYPNMVACADARSGILTYRKMKIRALLLASYIKTLPGKDIGVMLPASVGADVVILATLIAGKVPVMINWTMGPRHLRSIIQATGVQVILTAWGFIDRLRNVDLQGIEDLFVMLEDAAREIPLKAKLAAVIGGYRGTDYHLKRFGIQDLSPDEPAGILFTSGTESTPKGVPLSHHNIIANQSAAIKSIKLRSSDILYGTLPPFHSFGYSITGLLPILTGIKVAYSPDPTETKRLARGIKKWGITLYCSAPTFLKGVLRVGTEEQLKTVRLFVSGAEKAPSEIVKRVRELAKDRECEFLEGYGITECAPILTFNTPGEPLRGVGKPISNVKLLIIHPETHEPLPDGETGLILANGPNVFSGYLNEKRKDPFFQINGLRWYNTGDLGYIDEEGNLWLAGRLKRFVKIGGEMVSLTSIEAALYDVAPQKGWPVGEEGPAIAACSTEKEGERPRIWLFTSFAATIDEINRSLREAGFSNLVKVSEVKKVDQIPLLGSGKINYRSLERTYCS